MNPTQHPSNNKVFGAPGGWDQQATPCQAIPVTVQIADDQPRITSYWRPTAEELAQLAAGGLVGLHIYGRGMPPVWLEATPNPMGAQNAASASASVEALAVATADALEEACHRYIRAAIETAAIRDPLPGNASAASVVAHLAMHNVTVLANLARGAMTRNVRPEGT